MITLYTVSKNTEGLLIVFFYNLFKVANISQFVYYKDSLDGKFVKRRLFQEDLAFIYETFRYQWWHAVPEAHTRKKDIITIARRKQVSFCKIYKSWPSMKHITAFCKDCLEKKYSNVWALPFCASVSFKVFYFFYLHHYFAIYTFLQGSFSPISPKKND